MSFRARMMSIAGGIHEFAETLVRGARPPAGEIGFAGLRRYAGIVDDDYNPDLRGTRGIEIFERMITGDGQVQAVCLAMTLPIRSAPWYVEPASDDPRAQQTADFVEEALFQHMTVPWSIFLHHALLSLFYGYVVFEKVFEVADNRVWWRKFAPRHPRTIWRWLFGDDGGLAGCCQAGMADDGTYKDVEIPIEKLLVCTWQEEWEDPTGRSLLRAAYKHWYMKDQLYAIANIGVERNAVGVPVTNLPVGYTEEDKATAEEIGTKVRSHEASSIALPPGYTMTVLEGRLNTAQIMPLIEHHDLMIARSVLAQFLNLGATNRGALNLSQDHRRLFLLALNAVADWICDLINRYAIPQLLSYNYPGALDPGLVPALAHGAIQDLLDVDTLMQQAASLAQYGLLTPDPDLENRLRQIMDLPEIQEPASPKHPAPASAPKPPGGGPAPGGALQAAEPRQSMAPAYRFMPPEQVAAIKARLGRVEGDFEGALRSLLDRQLSALVEQISQILRAAEGQAADDRGLRLARLMALDVPLTDDYRRTIRSYLDAAVHAGRAAVTTALGYGPMGLPQDIVALLDVQADAIARKHAGDLLYAASQEVLDGWAGNLSPETIVWNVTQRLRDRVSVTAADTLARAMEMVDDGVNAGLALGASARG